MGEKFAVILQSFISENTGSEIFAEWFCEWTIQL